MRAALAVDIGGTDLRAAFVDAAGAVGALVQCPTDARGGPEAVMAQIEDLLGQATRGATGASPVGLGLAVPGPLDAAAGIVIGPPTLDGWRDVPLARLMSERLGLPVRIENDANAAALGEWRFGAGRGTDSMVFVTVSTGIGGGIVADGRLLRGRRGLAGEIGHMTIDAGSDASLFGGAPGSFEALASGTALGREAARRADGSDGARLRALAGGDAITARHVVAAARGGDGLALALMVREARLLGLGFANLLHLYSPERIVVGGGLGSALDLMADEIAATVRVRALPAYRDVPIVPAALGLRAGLVGVASLLL